MFKLKPISYYFKKKDKKSIYEIEEKLPKISNLKIREEKDIIPLWKRRNRKVLRITVPNDTVILKNDKKKLNILNYKLSPLQLPVEKEYYNEPENLLAVGAFGSIYEINKNVVIKVVKIEKMSHRLDITPIEAQQVFEKQVKLMKYLSKNGCGPTVYDAYFQIDTIGFVGCIIMKKLFKTLAQVKEENDKTIPTKYVNQITKILKCISKKYEDCDLRLENWMIDKKNRLYKIDPTLSYKPGEKKLERYENMFQDMLDLM